jgi:hypothetical protein
MKEKRAIACLLLATAFLLGSSHASPNHPAAPHQAPAAYQTQALGRISMKCAATGQWTDLSFQYLTNDHADGIHDLFTIASLDNKKEITPYQLHLTNERLLAAYPRYFQSLGYLLCTEWEWGAGSIELIVFRLDESGQLAIAFRGVSRFGYSILNISGGPISDICEGTGYLPGPQQMKIYSWTGASFTLSKTIPVHDAHRYAILTGDPATLPATRP